jgi:hypothetical protein
VRTGAEVVPVGIAYADSEAEFVRKKLPRRLVDRPDDLQHQDFALLPDCSAEVCLAWMRHEVDAVRSAAPPPEEIEAEYRRRLATFQTLDVAATLRWFSGKDMLAALHQDPAGIEPWATPGAFRADVLEWVRDHPDDACAAIPEWARLRDLVLAA